jgi:hypothetical protein
VAGRVASGSGPGTVRASSRAGSMMASHIDPVVAALALVALCPHHRHAARGEHHRLLTQELESLVFTIIRPCRRI